MVRVFVIRPFGRKKDSSGKELDFERVHTDLLEPALRAANLAGSTTGEIVDAGNIREDMFSLILEADLVICDITIHNANVFYELGIRHALRKKGTILIKGVPVSDGTPFDLLTDRYFAYSIDNPAADRDKLIQTIKATLASDRTTDSPIFQMLPTLPEADPASVQAVPLDFIEEIDRARAAQSKGWLRLLAQDIRGLRFQWIGLQLIAKALWDLEDYEGARDMLEQILGTKQYNVTANLSLANVYERLYRNTRKSELLQASEQAISRVLESRSITAKNRVEALTLKGRNQKTRWRQKFEQLLTLEERREAAMSQALRDSYQAYRDAFYQDLNHFYAGLTALQMGTIFLDLSEEPDDKWKITFNTDGEADTYRGKLIQDIKILHLLVPASVEAARSQLKPTDSEWIWANISNADLLFLTEPNARRVIKRYQDELPENNLFAWNAVKGQLQLFAALGVKADLAHQVIGAIDKQFASPAPANEKDRCIVIFAGHRVDADDRKMPRFPKLAESKARELIRTHLETIARDGKVEGLASAAPGSDILFHEVCAELNILSMVCLPMPKSDYARQVFNDLDTWRTRFLNLTKTKQVLELSDRSEKNGLPRWLEGTNTNPWERGNHWVLQMALTSGAEKIILLAVWDGKNEGDDLGGTAHMVQLARNTGRVEVEIIDVKALTPMESPEQPAPGVAQSS